MPSQVFALALAGILALAACANALRGGAASPSTEGSRSPSIRTAPDPERLWGWLPPGWSELEAPPVVRARAVSVWTGRELVYWGGDTHFAGQHHADGASFDPIAGTWHEVAPSPLAGRSSAGAVWTGTEVIVWGGWADEPFSDGAAYTPETNTWRTLPEGPLSGRDPVAVVWTGGEVIVWGNASRAEADTSGAAYDPASDRWRTIAQAPLALNEASAVWTGREMLIYGALLDHNNSSDTRYARGLAYEPAADSWRLLPDFPLSPQASTAVWSGQHLLVWDYEFNAGTYDPVTDRWRELPGPPFRFYECYPASTALPNATFAWSCGQAALFDVGSELWQEVGVQRQPMFGGPVAADGVVLFAGAAHESVHNALWVYKPDEPASG